MADRAKTRVRAPRPLRVQVYRWSLWLHLYASMLSLLVTLFFAATGITLNHTDWVFGNAESEHTYDGKMPDNWKQNGEVNWLQTAEALRATHRLKGRVSDTRSDDQEASISFRAPAYSADAFINVEDGSYSLKVVARGPVEVLNDLHRGRDAGRAWAWLIDLSGGFLLLVSLTGLVLSLFLRKTRRAAVITAVVGAVIMVLLIWRIA